MSSVVSPLIQIHVPLQGLVDVGVEIVKMERVQDALMGKLRKLKEQMSQASYAKVPEATRKKNDEQLANDSMELSKLDASVANFKSVLNPDQLKQYLNDKMASYALEADKLAKGIEKLKAALPAEVAKQPKKSLLKIAEAEQELAEVQEQIKQMQLKL